MLDRLGTARWLLVSHREAGQQPAACAPALPATSTRPGLSRSFFSLAAPHAPQPRSVYYVASPEACAAILWKSREKAGTVRRPGMLRQWPPVLCALISKGCITAERAQLRVNTLCLVPALLGPPWSTPAASGEPAPGLAPARCLPPFCGAPTIPIYADLWVCKPSQETFSMFMTFHLCARSPSRPAGHRGAAHHPVRPYQVQGHG